MITVSTEDGTLVLISAVYLQAHDVQRDLAALVYKGCRCELTEGDPHLPIVDQVIRVHHPVAHGTRPCRRRLHHVHVYRCIEALQVRTVDAADGDAHAHERERIFERKGFRGRLDVWIVCPSLY